MFNNILIILFDNIKKFSILKQSGNFYLYIFA